MLNFSEVFELREAKARREAHFHIIAHQDSQNVPGADGGAL